MSERILVAEDEEILRTNVCEFLGKMGYEVEGAADGAAALERVLEEDFAVVLADLRMPRLDGMSLLKRIVAERPETLVVVTTAYASVESAVDALRCGAYDYLLKPVVFEDLLQKVRNLVAYRTLKEEVVRLRRDLHTRLGFEGLVGGSPAMRAVFELVEKVAPTRSTVLITGESGTGKELVARAIHARSAVRNREFLATNMAAIPGEMVEDQLFGHDKGAFTGADRRREGLLRSARGGTVFLDEVGELPMAAQAKLLRAIESHEVLPVGADRTVEAEFRLVAATNQNLAALVQQGRFRRDLFFRLNVFGVVMPPLRERREDIPALVDHFVKLHGRALGKQDVRVSNESMRRLLAYRWPGNVRELSNVIERATILAADTIQPEHLPGELRQEEALPIELRPAVERFERRHIEMVLRTVGGNRERTARMLGVDPATLYRKLARYGIDRGDSPDGPSAPNDGLGTLHRREIPT